MATRTPPWKVLPYGANCDNTAPVVLVDHRDELRRVRTLARPDDDHTAFLVVEVGLVRDAHVVK